MRSILLALCFTPVILCAQFSAHVRLDGGYFSTIYAPPFEDPSAGLFDMPYTGTGAEVGYDFSPLFHLRAFFRFAGVDKSGFWGPSAFSWRYEYGLAPSYSIWQSKDDHWRIDLGVSLSQVEEKTNWDIYEGGWNLFYSTSSDSAHGRDYGRILRAGLSLSVNFQPPESPLSFEFSMQHYHADLREYKREVDYDTFTDRNLRDPQPILNQGPIELSLNVGYRFGKGPDELRER